MLAIGVVVDDAIVVIENVERHITTLGKDPVTATCDAMKEVIGPVIATTLVLLAVFIPVGFMPGITGIIYKQFSVTIAVAVCISSINALTLSPALCATFLKPGSMGQMGFLKPVEHIITRLTGGYTTTVGWMLRRSILMGILFLILISSAVWLMKAVPTGFVPNEDQGFLFMDLQLPDAASINRTDEVFAKVTDRVKEEKGVSDFVAITGFSLFSGAGSNNGFGIVILDDWDQRKTPDTAISAISQRLQGKLWMMPDAQIMVFETPPIPGLGDSGGFEYKLQDTQGRTPQELAQVMNGLIYRANQQPELSRVFGTFRANVPQYFLEVDRNKVKAMGISLSDVFLSFTGTARLTLYQ